MAWITRRSVAVLTLAGVLSGCGSWEPQLVPVSVVLDAAHPTRIKVATERDLIELSDPRIQGDTLTGLDRQRRAGVPVSSVNRVWVRRANPVPLLIGIPIGITVGLVALVAATWND